jgi:TolB-like protein/Flp pilus assembly protein TadD
MASLLQGYEYDIFISYRQKDNKGDRWVSEFVDALKTELESTFKEDLKVYFDINPHDGLLETHDVNASLKEKLKCIIFIPIISQTYCDPRCFAWHYEFVAFNKTAKEDHLGRDIRLTSGNVASRILPVKIHDLDHEDMTLLENELGGVLRCIEFIYKSPGVNRPLRINEDHPQDNLNKTYYRDQINKVANAVKEIIIAIKRIDNQDSDVTKKIINEKAVKVNKKLSLNLVGLILILAFIVLGYYFFPDIKKSPNIAGKAIAVLPFDNMSDKEELFSFGDAMTDEIIQQLYKIKEFIVRPRPSVMRYKATTKKTSLIGQELKVNYIIGGSTQRFGDRVRIRVHMINVVADTLMWSENFEGNMKDILSFQSDIAKQIAANLKIVLSKDELKQIEKKLTENPEALEYYLHGNYQYTSSYETQSLEIAAKMYEMAINLDQKFALAYVRLSLCYSSLYWFDSDQNQEWLVKSKEAIDKAFKIDPDLPQAHLALGSYYYWGYLNYAKALEEVTLAQKWLSNNSECFYTKGNIYRRAGEWTLAKENYLKALELDPSSSQVIFSIAETLSLLCEYKEAEAYYEKAISLNPIFIEPIWQKSFMYLKWKGNTIQARRTIEEAFKFKECRSDPRLIEFNFLLDIYDGNYKEALSVISSSNYELVYYHLYFNLKSLLYAKVYGLMGMAEKEYNYYDSARINLESRILKSPDDPRLLSAIGFAYAGLGRKKEAIDAGMRAVDLMRIDKEAYRGAARAEDLARIYVMVGEYNAAIEQIKLLLSVPSRISVKLLLLDPVWKPLWNLPDFKKMIDTTTQVALKVK